MRKGILLKLDEDVLNKLGELATHEGRSRKNFIERALVNLSIGNNPILEIHGNQVTKGGKHPLWKEGDPVEGTGEFYSKYACYSYRVLAERFASEKS